MRRRLWLLLLLWILGIVFPIAWLGHFSPTFRRLFDAIFAPNWIHVLMHALLFAGLGFLLTSLKRPGTLKTALLLGCGAVLLVGLGQEFFQFLNTKTIYVGGIIYDLGVDLAGGAAGILAAYGLFCRKSRAY